MDTVKKGSWEPCSFKNIADNRGHLVALNALSEIPFCINRVYFMTLVESDTVRGLHAHKELDQVLIAVKGSVTIKVNNGFKERVFILDDHSKGLRITNLIWRELYDFSADCVLLTLASQAYQEDDYIRNFSEFQDLALKINREI